MSGKKETEASFRKRMATITVPDGFVTHWDAEKWPGQSDTLVFILEKPDEIKLQFDHTAFGGGHTSFKSPEGGWRTFDRRGVDDSFHHIQTRGKGPDKKLLSKN